MSRPHSGADSQVSEASSPREVSSYPLQEGDDLRSGALDFAVHFDDLSRMAISRLPATGGVVAEIGCGEGAFTELLREHLDPSSFVVGLDLEPSRANPWTDCVVGTMAPHLPLRDGSVDLIAARFSLTYVADSEAMVSESLRVLRPGGWFVAHEMLHDHQRPASTVYPKLPSFWRLLELTRAVWDKTGAVECLPLKLPGLLRAAGFAEVELVPSVAIMIEETPRWYETRIAQLRDMSAYIVSQGIVSTLDEIEEVAAALEAEYKSVDGAGLGIPTMAVLARAAV